MFCPTQATPPPCILAIRGSDMPGGNPYPPLYIALRDSRHSVASMNAEPIHVAGICGSLRDRSHTRRALTCALEAAETVDATTELIDLRELELPLYDADENNAGDASLLKRRVRGADALLLGTPMYHGSYASVLKTALDYCGFDEFENKTIGLLAVSGGSFPLAALDHLRVVCRALDAWVLPHQAAIPNAHRQFEDGELVDGDLRERVETLGMRVVQFAKIEPDPASIESQENVGAGDHS